jgi:hypothetical protein
MITDNMGWSLAAFHGSKNCDHDTPETFYSSYMKRKKLVIERRLHAVEDGDMNVNRQKLKSDVEFFKEAKENKEEILLVIKTIEEGKVKPGDSIIKEAESLISDI